MRLLDPVKRLLDEQEWRVVGGESSAARKIGATLNVG
jgi:hypothetical protein